MTPFPYSVESTDAQQSAATDENSSQCDDSPTCSTSAQKVKCVLVGDGAVGKTSLVVSYTTNGYPQEYVPTAFDNYSVLVRVDEKPIRFQLCDTAGQDDFDSLRPLCYPSTDVFLLCFSVVSPTSFHNLREHWVPEVREHCPHTPVLIVGTQSDLRANVTVCIELAKYGELPVTEDAAHAFAKAIGAVGYVECSALTQHNLKEVFDGALLAALKLAKDVDPVQQAQGGRSRVLLEFRGRKSFRRLRDKVRSSLSSSSVSSGASRKLKHSLPSSMPKHATIPLMHHTDAHSSSNNRISHGFCSSAATGYRTAPCEFSWKTQGAVSAVDIYDSPATVRRASPADAEHKPKGWRRLLCVQ